MKWTVVQIRRRFRGTTDLYEPCFVFVKGFDTLHEAQNWRNVQSDHDDYIIIQAW